MESPLAEMAGRIRPPAYERLFTCRRCGSTASERLLEYGKVWKVDVRCVRCRLHINHDLDRFQSVDRPFCLVVPEMDAEGRLIWSRYSKSFSIPAIYKTFHQALDPSLEENRKLMNLQVGQRILELDVWDVVPLSGRVSAGGSLRAKYRRDVRLRMRELRGALRRSKDFTLV